MRDAVRVVHLTSAHQAGDGRIFARECVTLAEAGYDVVLVAPHDGDEVREGVRIRAVPRERSRWRRITRGTLVVARAAWRERGGVYHFHDPELVPVGLALKALGCRVIYDVHEAYGEKLQTRAYVPARIRPLVAAAVAAVHRFLAGVFDGIVVADRFVAAQMPGRVLIVANVPRLERFPAPGAKPVTPVTLIYAGDLSRERGLATMLGILHAMPDAPLRLELFGALEHPEDEALVRMDPRVVWHGVRPHAEVASAMARAHIGLLLFEPVPGYRYAAENTTKLFEYMAAGCAVLASDFPGLRDLVAAAGTGLCVDPGRPDAVAAACRRLVRDPAMRTAMGVRGRTQVVEHWNWGRVGSDLVAFYDRLLGHTA